MNYTCHHCGEEYESGWTNEDAMKEFEKLKTIMPIPDPDDMVVVCDICWRANMPQDVVMKLEMEEH